MSLLITRKRNMSSSRLMKYMLFAVIMLLIGLNIPSPQGDIIQSDIDSNSNDNDGITKLKWMGPYGTYEDYINGRSNQVFSIYNIAETIYEEDNPLIIIFVNSNLIPALNKEIFVYKPYACSCLDVVLRKIKVDSEPSFPL